MQTLPTTLCNIAGDSFTTEIQYKYDRLANAYVVFKPSFVDDSFGAGWVDDLVLALDVEIGKDYELKIIE